MMSWSSRWWFQAKQLLVWPGQDLKGVSKMYFQARLRIMEIKALRPVFSRAVIVGGGLIG